MLSGELDAASESLVETQVMECKGCEKRLAKLSDSDQIGQWKALLSEDSGAQVPFTGGDVQQAIAGALGTSDEGNSQIQETLESAGFRDIAQIGAGGMGVVFRARQPTLNRTIAVKVLKGNLSESTARKRFVREAESISRIKHKNVLQIYDVGETNGLPWIVFEFIEGPSLAKFLDRQPQDPLMAAEVTRQVARGVAAAHDNKIIHRDIKPANILLMPVGQNQGKQLNDFMPKVADFGLAKEHVSSEADTKTQFTQTDQIVGTPTYMSPEQIAGKQEQLSFASDVYSIGVLLYEMLTGYPPFTGKSAFQLLRNIETLDPISPRRQNKSIQSDLEAICLKCLEKDPHRRYPDANAVAEDLDRFIAGKPVLAKSPGWFQKLNKWVRRKPAAASLIATLSIGTVIALVVWANVTREMADLNTELQTQNQKLIQQKKIADDINSFLQKDLLRQASSASQMDWLVAYGKGPGAYKRDPSLKSILDRSASKVKSDTAIFDDEPRVKASLLKTIAETYLSLGDHDEAIEFFKMALELFPDSEIEDIASTKRNLAAANTAIAEYPKAIELLEASQNLYRELGESYQSDVLELDRNLAEIYLLTFEDETEKLSLPLEFAKRAHDGLTELLGKDHRNTLAATATLAEVKLASGETGDAIDLLGFVVEETGRQVGEAHPESLSAMFLLAKAKNEALQVHEALELKAKVWELAKESLGESHPETLYYQIFAAENIFHGKAAEDNAQDRTAQLENAVDQLEEAQKKLNEVYREDHPIHDQVVWNLFEAYKQLGKDDELISICADRLEILKSRPESRVIDIARIELTMGKAIAQSGKFDEAIGIFENCIEKLTSEYGEGNEWTGLAHKELGMAHFRSGKIELAADSLEAAYKLQCELLGGDNSMTMETGIGYYMCVNELQDYPRCEAIARSILENLNVNTPQDGFIALTIKQGLGIALSKQGKLGEAEGIMREVVEQYLKNYPDQFAGYQYMTLHGSVLTGLERYEEAEEKLLDAWAGLEKTSESFKSDELRKRRTRDVIVNLCNLYKAAGNDEKLEEWKSKLKAPQ